MNIIHINNGVAVESGRRGR